MINYLGPLLRDLLNPFISVIPGVLMAYFTYKLGKRKSAREEQESSNEEWRKLYHEAKDRNAELQHELDEERDKKGDKRP